MKKIKTGLAVVLVAGSLAACSPSSLVPTFHPTHKPKPSLSVPQTFDVTGTVSVDGYDSDYGVNGTSCTSSDGYSDISEGAQATLTNQSGTVLAVSDLDEGVVADGDCSFGFLFSGVPEGQQFYSIHVGNSNRGEVTYTRDQLNVPVELTLGS